MEKWLITPRDPLIFRNGKPFTAAPGSRAETLPIPYPSTLAGAVRTRAGIDPATGQFQEDRITSLLEKSIQAPVLVELDQHDQVVEYFLPAPTDAIFFKTGDPEIATRYDLKPLKVSDANVDLLGLSICGLANIVKDKPHPKAPSFWDKQKFLDWLENPKTCELVKLSEMGIKGIVQEHRTHVGIESNTLVAEDGALFQTSGLEFIYLDRKENEPFLLSETKQLGLLVITDAVMTDGIGHLGGERRTVRWTHKKDLQLPFETCPESIRKQILDDGHCRLILITPAYFKNGYLPQWLQDQYHVTVKAIINPRYQGISGWDYEKRMPKPSKRLMPAGSVLFLKLPESLDQREEFIRKVWMHSVSDDPEQNRLDGFGLALLGVWNGLDREMQMEVK